MGRDELTERIYKSGVYVIIVRGRCHKKLKMIVLESLRERRDKKMRVMEDAGAKCMDRSK